LVEALRWWLKKHYYELQLRTTRPRRGCRDETADAGARSGRLAPRTLPSLGAVDGCRRGAAQSPPAVRLSVRRRPAPTRSPGNGRLSPAILRWTAMPPQGAGARSWRRDPNGFLSGTPGANSSRCNRDAVARSLTRCDRTPAGVDAKIETRSRCRTRAAGSQSVARAAPIMDALKARGHKLGQRSPPCRWPEQFQHCAHHGRVTAFSPTGRVEVDTNTRSSVQCARVRWPPQNSTVKRQ